ncbi:MAG: sugar isomerase [Bryobacteraceae bacterium]
MSRSFVEHGCCSSRPAGCGGCGLAGVSRRSFLAAGGLNAVAASAAAQTARPASASKDPAHSVPPRPPLRVQPVFVNAPRTPRPVSSWRSTAEIYDEKEATQECARVSRELAELKAKADFPLEFLPLARVRSKEEADKLPRDRFDGLILFAASRNAEVLEALARPDKWNLIFVRHRSGRIYYMFIGVHGHYFRKRRDMITETAMDVEDVIVDDMGDLLWRLRALAGLKRTLNRRIVCMGTPGGWGADGRMGPELAAKRWKLDIQPVTYQDLERRIKAAMQNETLLRRCRAGAAAYLARKDVKLETGKEFVEKCFVLAEIFKDYMHEAQTDAFTISSCMGAVMQVAATTACIPLSVLNDQGYVALCEGDFQSAPGGMLLHDISGKPVFFANPSFPYKGEMMFSHCTAPSKLDGKTADPVRVVTHYESDFGAAPKVEFRKGMKLTAIDPDFSAKRFLGLRGQVIGAPFYPTCRSQVEIAFEGDTEKLQRNIRGWHWMLTEGDYLKEMAYASRKAGMEWTGI